MIGRKTTLLCLKRLAHTKEVFFCHSGYFFRSTKVEKNVVLVTKITKNFQEGSKDIYALVIDNPCHKKDFPKKVNRSYFCDGNDLDKKQISTHNGKLIIGLLYDAKYCQPSDLRKIYSNSITGRLCPIRNSTPLSEISSGMGDIFIKLAR